MHNSTKYSFILGLFCLAIGWVLFVQKTTSEIKSSKNEAFKLKSDLIELRWGQIINKEIQFGKLKSGPEVFNVSLAGLDKAIIDSEFERKYRNISPGIVKAAYLDSGLEAAFFTTKIEGSTFFVKVDASSENIKLQGYPYSYILNLLGAGLENDEWYFLDSKNRVVFSHKDSYLGKSRDFRSANSKNLKTKGQNYSIQIADGAPFSSSSILSLGLLGFLLLGFANFPSPLSSSPLDTAAMATADDSLSKKAIGQDVIVKKDSKDTESATDRVFEENVSVKEGLDFKEKKSLNTTNQSHAKNDIEEAIDDEGIDDEGVEGFKTLDLSSKASKFKDNNNVDDEVGYSEFLTENPSLSFDMPAIPNKRIIEDIDSFDLSKKKASENKLNQSKQVADKQIDEKIDTDLVPLNEEAATEVQLNEPERSGSDWIKLAEELSANLEKFAGEWEEKEPQPNNEA